VTAAIEQLVLYHLAAQSLDLLRSKLRGVSTYLKQNALREEGHTST